MVPDYCGHLGPFLQTSSSTTRRPASRTSAASSQPLLPEQASCVTASLHLHHPWSHRPALELTVFMTFVAVVVLRARGRTCCCAGIPCRVGFHRFLTRLIIYDKLPPHLLSWKQSWGENNPQCKAFWATSGQSRCVCIDVLERVLEILILRFRFSSFILRFSRYQLHSVGNTERQPMYLYKINW